MDHEKHISLQREQDASPSHHLAWNARHAIQIEVISPQLSHRAQRDPRSLSPKDMRVLQRTIGNRAVAQLLQGRLESTHNRENTTGLPDTLKAGVENLSGLPMDDVRVHYNSSKPTEVQALAYTQGTDILVGPGQEQHLAHEAWHVVQQKQGRVQPTLQMKEVPINDDEGLESEADLMGARAATKQQTEGEMIPQIVQRSPQYVPPLHASTVIQRSINDLKLQNNVVTSVSTRGGRVGTKSGGQHITAYQVFLEMIRNNLLGKTVDKALDTLSELLNQIPYLPTYQSTKWVETRYWRGTPDTVIQSILNDIDILKKSGSVSANDLIYSANEIIAVRNSLDLVSYKNKRPTHSGVSEWEPAGALEIMDDNSRKGTSKHQSAEVYPPAWNLFHYDPPKKTDEQELAALLIQHAYTLMLAFPHVPELQSPDKTLTEGLTNKYIQKRVVNSPKYNWTDVERLVKNYGLKQIPQYRKTIQNQYNKIIGTFGFSLST